MAVRDALGKEEEVSLQVVWATSHWSAWINTLSFPLSGSEPGKGVGTLGGGDLKLKAAKQGRISPSLPSPHPNK